MDDQVSPDVERPASEPMTPFVAFFSRYGVAVLAAVLLIELAFHVHAVRSTRLREAAASAAPAAVVPPAAVPAPR